MQASLQRHLLACLFALGLAACGDDAEPTDAGQTEDTGPVDTGATDSGPIDTGVVDTGAPDTGPIDLGVEDTGPVDLGVTDTGFADAEIDAGSSDAGCVPSGDEICDDADNDCDGFIDNVDEAQDGIYDCSRIALFGNAGSLGSSNFLAWLESNGLTVARIQTDTASLTPALLADYDVVIIDRLVRDYLEGEAEVFRAWVESGGAVMSMTGYSGGGEDLTRPNSLLNELGLGYLPGLVGGPVTMFEIHPTTVGLTSITFSGGFHVDVLDGPFASTSTVVARLPNGPAAVAAERGAGRVFVWGDEWVQFDSEWQSLPEVRQFWVNVLGWITHFTN